MPTGKVKEVAPMLKAIHAQDDTQAATEKANLIVEKLRAMKLAKAAEIVAAGVKETLSCYALRRKLPFDQNQQPAGEANAGDPPTNASG